MVLKMTLLTQKLMKLNSVQKIFFILLISHQIIFAQKIDSSKTIKHFSGVITATNNGISLLPNFSLGKPAVLFDMSFGGPKLSFDPMLRFAMNGKPWAFIFWFRYKLAAEKKFNMSVGAHPAFIFRETTLPSNGVSKNYLTAIRFIASEATPTYVFNKHLSLGVHYLYSHGLTKDITQNTHFVAIRTPISNIPLGRAFIFSIIPQFYFLKMDSKSGTYINATAILSRHNFPISLSSIVSEELKSTIGGKPFVWNIALNYNFIHKYLNQK